MPAIESVAAKPSFAAPALQQLQSIGGPMPTAAEFLGHAAIPADVIGGHLDRLAQATTAAHQAISGTTTLSARDIVSTVVDAKDAALTVMSTAADQARQAKESDFTREMPEGQLETGRQFVFNHVTPVDYAPMEASARRVTDEGLAALPEAAPALHQLVDLYQHIGTATAALGFDVWRGTAPAE